MPTTMNRFSFHSLLACTHTRSILNTTIPSPLLDTNICLLYTPKHEPTPYQELIDEDERSAKTPGLIPNRRKVSVTN
jgi:hypothetical protein